MSFAWLVPLLAGSVLLGSRSVANGYLLVMYSRRHGLILMERGADERYHLFAPYLLPLVLLRYTALYAAYALLLLRRRLHGWGHPRKSVPLAAKA